VAAGTSAPPTPVRIASLSFGSQLVGAHGGAPTGRQPAKPELFAMDGAVGVPLSLGGSNPARTRPTYLYRCSNA